MLCKLKDKSVEKVMNTNVMKSSFYAFSFIHSLIHTRTHYSHTLTHKSRFYHAMKTAKNINPVRRCYL
jgi:hypothetical protein